MYLIRHPYYVQSRAKLLLVIIWKFLGKRGQMRGGVKASWRIYYIYIVQVTKYHSNLI